LGGILRFFALQELLVAPMGEKCGMEESTEGSLLPPCQILPIGAEMGTWAPKNMNFKKFWN